MTARMCIMILLYIVRYLFIKKKVHRRIGQMLFLVAYLEISVKTIEPLKVATIKEIHP